MYRHFIVLCAVLQIAVSTAQAAKPFCSLRDPTHEIYEMFPEASGYRSEVHEIDNDVRRAVAGRLPFTLHLRELGRHTIYVALDGEQELGLVHARSEASEWGLVEIAWSLASDLTVRDFRFQRCRGPGCKALSNSSFKAHVIGHNVRSLPTLLSTDQTSLAPSLAEAAQEHSALAVTIVQSAMKTIAVTEILRPGRHPSTVSH